VEHEIIANDLTEVVLVGHSLAGITLPGVAARVPDRLRRLVFIACAVPTDGQTIADVLPGIGRSRRSDGRRRITEHRTLHPEVAARMFCNEMDADQAAFTLERLVPEADHVMTEPVDLRGLQHPIPRTYIRLLRDASIIPSAQDKMITNLGGAEVIDLDAGHMAMISQPAQLADMLNAL
jgi:pimeloyl-ACP methyl ester carboxylesterase